MTFDPNKHPDEYRPTIVSKLSAAKRQLNCAIEMWFADKDQISIHTLVVAAHQIIHDIHDKTLPGKPLFLNVPLADETVRRDFVGIFKEAANFFKHANRDSNPGSTIEFSPFMTQIFFLYSIAGLSNLGETNSDTEKAYLMWFAIHHPNLANPQFVQRMHDFLPAEHIETARRMNKRDFLENMLEAQLRIRAR